MNHAASSTHTSSQGGTARSANHRTKEWMISTGGGRGRETARRETTATPTAAGRGHAEERNQRRSRRASHVPQVAMHASRAGQPSDDVAPQRVSVFMLATQSQSLFGLFGSCHVVESRQCAEIHSYSSATSAYTPRVGSRGRRGRRSGHESWSWIVVDRHGLPWVVGVAVRVAKSGSSRSGSQSRRGCQCRGHGHGRDPGRGERTRARGAQRWVTTEARRVAAVATTTRKGGTPLQSTDATAPQTARGASRGTRRAP